ncbi:methylated-DNA--[protein]-cysteine S-methyltransferase [Pseudomethylobacillus aquaticus]|uniref:methylated-DNA--[protein]-cysteine S-methyltransferase n=1 Tax=Pseudomethylobacillus aquaticus TaxID=2676064 RepID=A0A3N0V3E5_9PROT|nr:methylated-DNA--[protein]-cysteine S-methyltransferase [Pseudomethylobacillus aquaticus]ROH87061.1 methylated-DNA--[protein]-cysteine S-methyltransferase [Pseudomethylobacillus aquaticus]
MSLVFDAILPAPFGAIGIRTQDDYLLGLSLLPEVPASTEAQVAATPFVHSVIHQLQAYLNDPHAGLDIPIAITGTPFQRRVWRAIASIPSGETRSYGELAEMVGSGPRAVANACGANQVPLVIPCHRIVARHGLGGFMQGDPRGLLIKQWLLQHEQLASA